MADFEQVEGARKDHALKLYAISTCGWCRKARNFLDTNDIAYEFVYVDNLKGPDQAEVVEEAAKFNPGRTFPTLVIDGDDVVIGFKEETYREKVL